MAIYAYKENEIAIIVVKSPKGRYVGIAKVNGRLISDNLGTGCGTKAEAERTAREQAEYYVDSLQ